MRYPTLVKVRYYNEIDHKETNAFLLVFSDSFSEALKIAEEYYGNDSLYGAEVIGLDGEDCLEVSNGIAEELINFYGM